MKVETKRRGQSINELVEMSRRLAELETLEGERKQAKEALQESEWEYQRLLEDINDCYMVLRGEKIVFANRRCAELSGYSLEEIVGQSSAKFIAPEALEEALQIAQRSMSGEAMPERYESVLVRKDGTTFPVEFSFRDTIYEGRPAVSVLARDITERKRAEEALQESVERYRELVNSAPDAILVVDVDGKIHSCNPAAEQISGYKVEELQGKPFVELVAIDPGELPRAKKLFEDVMSRQSLENFEMKFTHKDGTKRWVSVKVRALRPEENITGIMVIARDITERKRMEEKLQGLYEHEKELRRKLEAEIDKRIVFARTLVHELKTPITSVLASSELLVEELKEEPWASLSKNINRGASNLNRRIDELLDLARGELGILQLNRKLVDPMQLLRGVTDDMTLVALSNGQVLDLQLPAFLPMVWADEERLRQVVLNLLNNAFKYTPREGKITLMAFEEEANLVVEVKDTGRGISKQERKRLFQPYHRLENDREHLSGLGLGLALSKQLVELHGGRIWVKSQKGKGSTFGFSVPLDDTGLGEGGVKTG